MDSKTPNPDHHSVVKHEKRSRKRRQHPYQKTAKPVGSHFGSYLDSAQQRDSVGRMMHGVADDSKTRASVVDAKAKADASSKFTPSEEKLKLFVIRFAGGVVTQRFDAWKEIPAKDKISPSLSEEEMQLRLTSYLNDAICSPLLSVYDQFKTRTANLTLSGLIFGDDNAITRAFVKTANAKLKLDVLYRMPSNKGGNRFHSQGHYTTLAKASQWLNSNCGRHYSAPQPPSSLSVVK